MYPKISSEFFFLVQHDVKRLFIYFVFQLIDRLIKLIDDLQCKRWIYINDVCLLYS